WLIRTKDLRKVPLASRARGQVRAALHHAWSVPELMIPLVMMAIIGTLAFNFQVVFPLLVTRTFGGTEAAYTALFSVIAIGSLCGALASARRRTIDVRDVVVAAATFGVSMMVFAAVPNLTW